MTTTRLCVARHGETDWNRLGILQGWLDVPLNALGRTQSQALAATLAHCPFAAVWSSPLARARESAEIVAAALHLSAPLYHDGLKEKNFGAVQGIPKDELAELNPALLEQILRRNPAAEFAGGESMDEFSERVEDALEDIAARHLGQTVLLITHGWVMDAITRHIQGQARHAVLHIKRKNAECIWLDATHHGSAVTLQAAAPQK
ncbi:MAG: histidine phosphatase family protein [Rhodoferax sp.]